MDACLKSETAKTLNPKPMDACLQSETGASNRRHMIAMYGGNTSGFEVVHGLLDHVMTLLRYHPSLSPRIAGNILSSRCKKQCIRPPDVASSKTKMCVR